MGDRASATLLLLLMRQLAGLQGELPDVCRLLEGALVSFPHPFAAQAQMRHPSATLQAGGRRGLTSTSAMSLCHAAGWWLTRLYPSAPWAPQGVARASTGGSSPPTSRSLRRAWVSGPGITPQAVSHAAVLLQ